jgi:uncharacterized membrane protein
MHDSGGADALMVGMLMTSAVAMFFSWCSLTSSDATDLSDPFAIFDLSTIWISARFDDSAI